jgi:hypothetical protein
MENEELRKLLQQLHDEIKNTRTVDEKGTELLTDLDEDIHALLERSDDNNSPIHPSIIQRLDAVLLHFEVTHPDLTVMISKLLDTLSNAGI